MLAPGWNAAGREGSASGWQALHLGTSSVADSCSGVWITASRSHLLELPASWRGDVLLNQQNLHRLREVCSAPCTSRSVQADQSAGSLVASSTEEAAWSGLWHWHSLNWVSPSCLQRKQRSREGLGALRKLHFTLLPILRNKNYFFTNTLNS